MTDDLVTRLREEDISDHDDANKLCNEAADCIEQLKATLRDQFAMAALGSFCRCETGAKEMAQLAYGIADAMMEARK